jgi:thymidylate kinase
MKHVFYIEGGDNVGKSTTIESIKDTKYIQKLIYNKIHFSRYPSGKLTNQINSIVESINTLDVAYGIDNTINYRELKNKYIDDLIGLMISDMDDSFSPKPTFAVPYFDRFKDPICQICDRGPLSTYLYQYRGYDGLDTLIDMPKLNELHLLTQFIKSYIPKVQTDLNIVILHNPRSIEAIENVKNETIVYKKFFDKDIKLQTRINNSLNNIVSLIKENQLSNLQIKFFYIDIFDVLGRRKSVDTICEELVKIINSTGGINDENNKTSNSSSTAIQKQAD